MKLTAILVISVLACGWSSARPASDNHSIVKLLPEDLMLRHDFENMDNTERVEASTQIQQTPGAESRGGKEEEAPPPHHPIVPQMPIFVQGPMGINPTFPVVLGGYLNGPYTSAVWVG